MVTGFCGRKTEESELHKQWATSCNRKQLLVFGQEGGWTVELGFFDQHVVWEEHNIYHNRIQNDLFHILYIYPDT